jgi:hypothetical protein
MNPNDYYLVEQGGKDRYQQLLREADEERILKEINAPSNLAEVLSRIRFALGKVMIQLGWKIAKANRENKCSLFPN